MRPNIPQQLSIVAMLSTSAVSSSTAQSATCQELHAATRATLHGVIVQRSYPGSPNYEVGNETESVKVLRLAKRVCRPRNASKEFAADANLVQLYFDAETESLATRAFAGCEARVEGELFEAESGHHHTPFVLAVTNVMVLKHCRDLTNNQ